MKSDILKCGQANWEKMLRAYPIRNRAVRFSGNSDGGIILYAKRQKPGWFVFPISLIVPFKSEYRIVLDNIGLKIWQLCDGSRNVEAIIDIFKDSYDLSFHEARSAITDYLKMLMKRGVIALVMEKC